MFPFAHCVLRWALRSIQNVGLEGGKVLATTNEEVLSDALDRMAGHSVSAPPSPRGPGWGPRAGASPCPCSRPLQRRVAFWASPAYCSCGPLYAAQVSALAVVDRLEAGAPWAAADAALQDTLSASDLRGCSVGDLESARGLSVQAFLDKRRGTATKRHVTCTRYHETSHVHQVPAAFAGHAA